MGDMGDRTSTRHRYEYRYGTWDIDLGYRYGMWYIVMDTYHIGMVIRDIDMGYGIMI